MEEEQIMTKTTLSDGEATLAMLELVLENQQAHSKMLLAILEVLGAVGATPTVRELLMCNIQKSEALEKKMELSPIEIPEPQPIESEAKLYEEMIKQATKLLGMEENKEEEGE